MTASLPPDPKDVFLTTADIAQRYGIDKRTARRVADEAGAMPIGRGLLVSLASLLSWEQRKVLRRRAAMRSVPAVSSPASVPQTLAPGWLRS
ncbi:MAG: hypothetical protein JWL76_1985 [Thermoleophilia bacterium]|nr:hypothetical protein [Thermoleophilia bacterium]